MDDIRRQVEVAVFETITDSLVERDYAVTDDFLSKAELTLLAVELHRYFDAGDFVAAGVGRGSEFQQNERIRGDYIHWISRQNLALDCHFLLDRLDALAQYLNQTCYLGIHSSEIHFACYPIGSFYKRHLDVFQKTNTRKISVVCYLNEDWKSEQGGQIRLFLTDKSNKETTLDVFPLGGRLVCFKSELMEHEVLAATRARLSITGWMKGENKGDRGIG